MNLRTTFLLLLLAAGAAAALYYQDALVARFGAAPRPAGADSPTLAILENAFRPSRLVRVEVENGGRVELVRTGKAWSLPGGWPTRGPEVRELVDLLAGLSSRFEPIHAGDAADLKPYGLDESQKPVRVTVTVESLGPEKASTYRLLVGEPPEFAGNPFTRPTYIRLDGQPEVVRAAPGLLAVLTRPADAYRKRQLFPDVQSYRIADARPSFPGDPDTPPPPVALLDAKGVHAAGPDGTWTLKRTAPPGAEPQKPLADLTAERLAARWELAEPVADRVDPERLKNVLAAVPELWVEGFVNNADPAKTGLDKPERTVLVEFDDRAPVKLLIGQVSRVVEKAAPPPPPANPFSPPPPPPPATREEYRYAKLPDNPQVFEVRSDKLGDLFVAPNSLRDAKLFRFRPADVQRVEVIRSDARIILAKEKDEATKDERWRIVEPVKADAEVGKVTELLDRIAELQASGPDIVDKADPKAYGLDPGVNVPHVTLTVTEEVPGNGDAKDKTKQTRTLTLRVGRHDDDKKKVHVQAADNPRIDTVGDEFLKLFDRPVLAYRGRRVLDVPVKQIASITVQRGGEKYRLEQAGGAWKLAEPVSAPADAAKAGQLANELSRLEVAEYVSDAPKPEELANDGLNQPALSATLTFTDAAQPPKTLQIGKPREGKPEVYARLADAPGVFALRESVKSTLDQPSLAYRPLQLWQLAAGSINAIEVQHGNDKYRLSRDGASWKISDPFDAPASAQAVQPLLGQLTAPRAERYEAQKTDDPAKYGLDTPELRVTVHADGQAAPKGLVVGKPAAADAKGRFAKPADGDAVVVIPEALVQAAERPALALLDRHLLGLNSNLIQQVRGTGPEGTWELKRAGGAWQITSTTPPAAADRQAAEALVRPWADLQAASFAAYGPQTDFAKYGLDRPQTTVTVTLLPLTGGTPESHTLALGRKVDGGDSVYARLDNGPGVAVLPAAAARELTHGALDFVDRTLLAFDPTELVAICRKGGAGDLELTRTDDGWQIVKPSVHKADQPGLEELAERLGGLRAARVAALDSSNLHAFGLDVPAATVTLVVKGKDGKPTEKLLHIGSPAPPHDGAGRPPVGEERFVQVDGSVRVAVLPAALTKRLLAEPLKFRDRTVARFADADRAFVEHGGRKVIFAKVDGTWKVTDPLSAEAEQMELDDLVNSVARLRADELVAERPADLKQYGLDKPEARWRFLAGDREVLNLLVGKRDEATGRNYAKTAAGDLVFLLDPTLSHRLLAEYRKRSLWSSLDAAQAETLVYNVGGATLVLQKADSAWQVAGKPEQAVNAEVVNEVLAALAGLKVERYVVDKGADQKLYGLQTPVRTIVVRTRSGTTATLYLGHTEGGSKRVYARVLDANRSDVFVLSEADSAKLVRELKDFTGK
jgi:hypothetical protein